MLVTDLIDLARNQSICDATLVASESDLRIAVQTAQSFGVRVHLVGLEPSRQSQSPLLRQEADTVTEIARADVAKFLTVLLTAISERIYELTPLEPIKTPLRSAQILAASEAKSVEQILPDAIQKAIGLAGPDDIEDLILALSNSSGIPKEYDGRLLGICRTLLGRELTGDERREMRNGFIRHLKSPTIQAS